MKRTEAACSSDQKPIVLVMPHSPLHCSTHVYLIQVTWKTIGSSPAHKRVGRGTSIRIGHISRHSLFGYVMLIYYARPEIDGCAFAIASQPQLATGGKTKRVRDSSAITSGQGFPGETCCL